MIPFMQKIAGTNIYGVSEANLGKNKLLSCTGNIFYLTNSSEYNFQIVGFMVNVT